MKVLEEIYGFIEYNEYNYPFFFDRKSFTLTVYPPNIELWQKDRFDIFLEFGVQKIEHKWIDMICLNGVTSEGYSACFYVSDDPYSNNGFRSYKVQWAAYHSGKFDFEKIDGFRMSGGDINRFYPADSVLNRTVRYNKDSLIEELQISSKRSDYVSCGKYRIEKNNDAFLELIAFASLSYNNYEKPISAKSAIRISFEKSTSINTVVRVVSHIKQFFYYSFYRSNIFIPDIELFWWDNNRMRNYVGRIIFNDSSVMDTDKKAKDSVIKYSFWNNKMSTMLREIKNNKIELNHICSSIDERRLYPPSRFFAILASFEREFRNIYGVDYSRSNEYKDEKDNVVNMLSDYADSLTGKRKKYIKGFISGISNSDDSYKDRVRISLFDCSNIMKPFIERNYVGEYEDVIDDISQRVGDLRNGFAHSRLDMKIDPINICDIQIIEILSYVIRMKKICKDELLIKKTISELFSLNMGF